MRLCILNSTTKICENIVSADAEQDFIPYKEGIELSPDHTGEIGWTWTESGWVTNEPQLSLEQKATVARLKRSNLLKQTVDRINTIRWESYSQPQKDVWIAYRQALLDVPQQEGFPTTINWPTKPDEPAAPTVPWSVTPLQIRSAINASGLRSAVDSYVATLDQTAQDAWEYATVIERNNSILVNGAVALGKTEEDIDNLFILASTFI